jgi:hypothetical protein
VLRVERHLRRRRFGRTAAVELAPELSHPRALLIVGPAGEGIRAPSTGWVVAIGEGATEGRRIPTCLMTFKPLHLRAS